MACSELDEDTAYLLGRLLIRTENFADGMDGSMVRMRVPRSVEKSAAIFNLSFSY